MTTQDVDQAASKISEFVVQVLEEYETTNGAKNTALLETLTRHAIYVRALQSALNTLFESDDIREEFLSFLNSHSDYLITRFITAAEFPPEILESTAKEANRLIKHIYELQKCLDTGNAH